MAEGGGEGQANGLVLQLQQMFPQFNLAKLSEVVQSQQRLQDKYEAVLTSCIDHLLAASFAVQDEAVEDKLENIQPPLTSPEPHRGLVVAQEEPRRTHSLIDLTRDSLDASHAIRKRKRRNMSPHPILPKRHTAYVYVMSSGQDSDLPDLGLDFSEEISGDSLVFESDNSSVTESDSSLLIETNDIANLPDLSVADDISSSSGSFSHHSLRSSSRGSSRSSWGSSSSSLSLTPVTQVPDVAGPKRTRWVAKAPTAALGAAPKDAPDMLVDKDDEVKAAAAKWARPTAAARRTQVQPQAAARQVQPQAAARQVQPQAAARQVQPQAAAKEAQPQAAAKEAQPQAAAKETQPQAAAKEAQPQAAAKQAQAQVVVRQAQAQAQAQVVVRQARRASSKTRPAAAAVEQTLPDLIPQPETETVVVQKVALNSAPSVEAVEKEHNIVQGNELLVLKNIPLPEEVEPVVVAPAVQLKPREKTPEETFDENLDTVLSLFPLVDPEYVRKVMPGYGDNQVELMVNNLLETKDYPQRQKKVPVVAAAKCDYLDQLRIDSHEPTADYIVMCQKLLQADFKKVSVKDIRRLAHLQNHCYAIIHNTLIDAQAESGANLTAAMADKKRAQMGPHSKGVTNEPVHVPLVVKLSDGKSCKISIKLLKTGRSREPWRSTLMPLNAALQQEVAFVSQRNRVADEEKNRQMAEELLEKEAEETGQLIECGCCFSERPFEHMVQCYEGHLFCRDCLKNYAKEAVYGQGKSELTCMSDGCDAIFPKDELKRALPPEMIEKYEERLREEALNLACLTDLVRCPQCDFAAVLPPDDKVFRCQNQECLVETCRYCKEEWSEHFGIPCKELEKKDATKMRVAYEEKMAMAVMRECHQCKAKFMKTDGCNRMTCRCLATMCYLCRKPKIDYNHFCRHVREPGKQCDMCNQCSLWSNPQEDDERAVEEIKKQALVECKANGLADGKEIGAPEEAKKVPAVQQQQQNQGDRRDWPEAAAAPAPVHAHAHAPWAAPRVHQGAPAAQGNHPRDQRPNAAAHGRAPWHLPANMYQPQGPQNWNNGVVNFPFQHNWQPAEPAPYWGQQQPNHNYNNHYHDHRNYDDYHNYNNNNYRRN